MGKLSMTMHASLQSNFRATASEVNRAFRLRLLGRDDAHHLVKQKFFFQNYKKGSDGESQSQTSTIVFQSET